MVSVVMPVYNASKYLGESISSVLNQKYENWELLCVDDGSTDDSLLILESYALKDQRIKVYSQENRGPAQARKVAINIASGKFIFCLDADDKISEDFLVVTVSSALETGADVTMPVLIQDCYSKNISCWDFNQRHKLEEGHHIDPRDAFVRTFPWSVHGVCLYKSAHMKKYALTDISEVNDFNADEYLSRYLLLYANKIVVSAGVYYYRANESSITRKFSLRKIGALKVNSLLFDLAIKERFEISSLKSMSVHFFKKTVLLKYNLIINRHEFSKSDFLMSYKQLSRRYSWHDYVPVFSVGLIKLKLFDVMPLFFATWIVELRRKLDKK